MSDRKHTVILSPAAQVDFTDILLYTRQLWGEAQRDRYEAMLTQRFPPLPTIPNQGRDVRSTFQDAGLIPPSVMSSTTELGTTRSRSFASCMSEPIRPVSFRNEGDLVLAALGPIRV
jgi:plasmid stabilization system protein ParE